MAVTTSINPFKKFLIQLDTVSKISPVEFCNTVFNSSGNLIFSKLALFKSPWNIEYAFSI